MVIFGHEGAFGSERKKSKLSGGVEIRAVEDGDGHMEGSY